MRSRWKTYQCRKRDRRGRLIFVDELTTPHRIAVGDSIFLGGQFGMRDYVIAEIDGDDVVVAEVHG